MKKVLMLEKSRFDTFMRAFKNGVFGSQRLGQAFYDYFKLYRVTRQEDLDNVYNKDGEAAEKSIKSFIEFN